MKSSTSRSPSSTIQLRSPLPINYKMPAVKFQTGWSYWLFGDPAKKVPPFQLLRGSEFSSKTCRNAFWSYRKVMLRVEKEVLKVHPNVNFKRDFSGRNIVTNVANVHKADEYFEVGSTAIVGNANNGKYIAKTTKRYKSKPVAELSISTVRRRMSPYVVTNATTTTTGSSSVPAPSASINNWTTRANVRTPTGEQLGEIRAYLEQERNVDFNGTGPMSVDDPVDS